MKLLKNSFNWKKKPVRLLGRGGMSYNDGQREYYIDSDNMPPRESGIGLVIFYKGIKLKDDSTPLSDEDRMAVAQFIKDYFEKKGGKIEISSAG